MAAAGDRFGDTAWVVGHTLHVFELLPLAVMLVLGVVVWWRGRSAAGDEPGVEEAGGEREGERRLDDAEAEQGAS